MPLNSCIGIIDIRSDISHAVDIGIRQSHLKRAAQPRRWARARPALRKSSGRK
jgi:hypothetical protein